MRLEVLIGDGDPRIYPIKGSRVVIGSAETSDIVLPSNGISRKHLIVAAENDQYYVIDQGSTNGSYLNEERLVPGRRVEFTSFFPVRLGDDVLISLISDDEDINDFSEISKPNISLPQAQVRSDHDSTSVISLKQLKEVKTDKLIKKREEKRKTVKNKTAVKQPVKKKKSKLDVVSLVAISMVAMAAYYNFFVMVPEEVTEDPAEVTVSPSRRPVQKAGPSFLIDQSNLTSVENLKNLPKTIKCVTDVEQYLCQIFTPAPGLHWGVTQIGTMSHVLLDVAPYLEEARKLISYPEPMDINHRALYEKHTKEVVAFYFLMTATSLEALNEEKSKDLKLTFSFYKVIDSEPEFYFGLAITPEALKEFKSHMRPTFLDVVKNPDNDIMTFARKHYTVY